MRLLLLPPLNSAVTFTSEALVLGLASGPACMASCGPVLVPWLLEQPAGISQNAAQMMAFLGARLAGYLVFAVAAWAIGLAFSFQSGNGVLTGVVHLLLASALVVYAIGRWRHACVLGPGSTEGTLVQIGAPATSRWSPWTFGFLTGLSLCPPFLVAGMRAAELHSLPLALWFFVAFFLGTALWFLPVAGLGWIRRTEAVVTVARIALLLLAAYYGLWAVVAILGGILHGR